MLIKIQEYWKETLKSLLLVKDDLWFLLDLVILLTTKSIYLTIIEGSFMGGGFEFRNPIIHNCHGDCGNLCFSITIKALKRFQETKFISTYGRFISYNLIWILDQKYCLSKFQVFFITSPSLLNPSDCSASNSSQTVLSPAGSKSREGEINPWKSILEQKLLDNYDNQGQKQSQPCH